MPIKRTILFKSSRDILLPRSHFAWIHGLFFKWLEVCNTELGKKLHGQSPAPFALSPVKGLVPSEKTNHLILRADEYVSFEISELNGILEEWLEEASACEISFHERNILLVPGGLKKKTYQELLDSAREKKFSFLTPTTFRHYGRNVPLPIPELVFGNLFRRWQAFAPQGLLPEEPDLRNILIKKFKLISQMLEFSKFFLTAFVGESSFVASSEESQILLGTLANFAWFAGVGYKTTMGLGVVEVN